MLYDSFASRGLFMYISSELKASYKSYTFATVEYRTACKLGVVGGQKELLSQSGNSKMACVYDSFLLLLILALKEHLTMLLEGETLSRTAMYMSHVSMR
jgi:hypothetical protein